MLFSVFYLVGLSAFLSTLDTFDVLSVAAPPRGGTTAILQYNRSGYLVLSLRPLPAIAFCPPVKSSSFLRLCESRIYSLLYFSYLLSFRFFVFRVWHEHEAKMTINRKRHTSVLQGCPTEWGGEAARRRQIGSKVPDRLPVIIVGTAEPFYATRTTNCCGCLWRVFLLCLGPRVLSFHSQSLTVVVLFILFALFRYL